MAEFFVARSVNPDAAVAVSELAKTLPLDHIETLLFFCSVRYDLKLLASALQQFFPEQQRLGCTTAGEISLAGYEEVSIVAIGFNREFFRCQPALIEDLPSFDLARAQQTVDHVLAPFGTVASQQMLALTLLDGLSSQEELVLLHLETALGNIAHLGGSAGDNNQHQQTFVFYQQQFYSNAAIMLLLQTAVPFQVFSGHHLKATAQKFVVTAASADHRTIYELDAEPAAMVYARMVGIEQAELCSTTFALYPLAVKMGQDYYVRSIQRVNDDQSLTFYCAVGLGAVLTRMQAQPMLEHLHNLLAEQAIFGETSLILACDCVLRRQELSSRDQLTIASEYYQQKKIVGFSSYGEHFNGIHVNQTMTGVMFGLAPKV